MSGSPEARPAGRRRSGPRASLPVPAAGGRLRSALIAVLGPGPGGRAPGRRGSCCCLVGATSAAAPSTARPTISDRAVVERRAAVGSRSRARRLSAHADRDALGAGDLAPAAERAPDPAPAGRRERRPGDRQGPAARPAPRPGAGCCRGRRSSRPRSRSGAPIRARRRGSTARWAGGWTTPCSRSRPAGGGVQWVAFRRGGKGYIADAAGRACARWGGCAD